MKKLVTLLLVFTGIVSTASADDTWTVAGDNETVFGSTWSESANTNDLAKVSKGDLYFLKKTGVTLAAGTTVNFKVVKDHAWTEAYPGTGYGDNYSLYIEIAGTYDIIFTFDPTTHKIGAFTSMTLAGDTGLTDFNWSTTETSRDLTFNEDYGFFTLALTKAYTPGTYEFKIVKDHRWDNGAWPKSNYNLKISTAGTYTIHFNFYPGDESVLAAEAVTTNANGYCTYVNYNPVNITTAAAYYATDNGTGNATAHSISNPVADTPMLIKGNDGNTMYYFQIYENGYSPTSNAFIKGAGTAVAGGDGPFNYILKGDQFYLANNNMVAANKAYLQLSQAASARPLIFEDEDVTGIKALDNVTNSQLDNYYNLQGVKVAKPAKGLYIVNGKKVVMK